MKIFSVFFLGMFLFFSMQVFSEDTSHEVAMSRPAATLAERPKLKGAVLVTDIHDVNKRQLESIRGLKTEYLDLPGKIKELEQIFSDKFFNHYITKDLIIQIKREIISYYQKYYFPFVSVHIPEQNISTGVLQIVITFGELDNVIVVGNKWFSEEKLKSFIRLKKGEKINTDKINEDVFWINQNPFRRVDVIYSPGKKKKSTDIELFVKDRFPLRLYTGIDNTGNSITKRNRFFAGFNWGKFFGTEQRLSYQFTSADVYDNFSAHTAYYEAPLPWRHNLILFGGYSKVKGKYYAPYAHEDSFHNHGYSVQTSLRYDIPIYSKLDVLQDVSFGFDYKRMNNNLDFGGMPIVGKSVNLTQIMLSYNLGYEIKPLSTSFEIEGFCSPGKWLPDQTNDDYQTIRPFAKVRYGYFRSTFSLIWRYYKDWALQTFLRGQVSSTNLLPSEQYGLGGYNTVRGYPEREYNADDAFIWNLEMKTPTFSFLDIVLRKKNKMEDQMQFLIFFDLGWGNKDKADSFESKTQTLLSIGPGVRYNILPYLIARFDYGFQLRHLPTTTAHRRAHFSVIIGY